MNHFEYLFEHYDMGVKIEEYTLSILQKEYDIEKLKYDLVIDYCKKYHQYYLQYENYIIFGDDVRQKAYGVSGENTAYTRINLPQFTHIGHEVGCEPYTYRESVWSLVCKDVVDMYNFNSKDIDIKFDHLHSNKKTWDFCGDLIVYNLHYIHPKYGYRNYWYYINHGE